MGLSGGEAIGLADTLRAVQMNVLRANVHKNVRGLARSTERGDRHPSSVHPSGADWISLGHPASGWQQRQRWTDGK